MATLNQIIAEQAKLVAEARRISKPRKKNRRRPAVPSR